MNPRAPDRARPGTHVRELDEVRIAYDQGEVDLRRASGCASPPPSAANGES